MMLMNDDDDDNSAHKISRFGKTLSIYLVKGAYTRYEEQPNLLKKEGK